jgi:formylglycine-generating enzyme
MKPRRAVQRPSALARHAAALFVGAGLLLSGRAGADRLSEAQAWWTGLEPASHSGIAAGVLTLRETPGGRVRIPGGTFTMGSTAEAMLRALSLCEREVFGGLCRKPDLVGMLRAEGAQHEVTLSAFDMDRTEVTVGDYMRCVSAGHCAPPEFSPTDSRFARAELPVTHVRWDDAADYCQWAHGRLPTEAEWEYAARGAAGREFPWGNEYNPHLANHGAWASDKTDATDGFVGLAPVGSFPDGKTPLGLFDLAGNAAEWVSDVFEFDAQGQPVGYAAERVVDPPAKKSGGGFHVVRGGSYESAPMWLRSASRDWSSLPRPAAVGFRCAADVN